jgi:hypothetical protein
VDELVRIIDHPGENDGVRLHAFQGLEQIFGLTHTNDPRGKGLFQGKSGPERLQKALTSTLAWLEANVTIPESKLQYLSPRHQAAVRYVRRAAIGALGAARRPLLVDNRQDGKQTGHVAELFCRILSGNGAISPPTDPREQLETALALCKLRAAQSPSYQPDFAAMAIAKFLVEYGSIANNDKERKRYPWQTNAEFLRRELDGFANQPGLSSSASGYIKSMVTAARPLLEYFDDSSKNPTAVQGLSGWLGEHPSPSRSVYKPLGEK